VLSSYKIFRTAVNRIYFHVMFPILLPDFNHNWRIWMEFRSSSPHRVSRKCVQWGAALIHADRRTDRHNTGNRRFSRECAQKESSIEMGVIDGHLPYLFILKIKDIMFSIRYRDAKPYKTTENNRPESLRYCIVVFSVHHTYYKNVERGERRKGKVLRAHRCHSRKHQPLNYLHTTRVRKQRHIQSVLLERLPCAQTAPILIWPWRFWYGK
jgi:hypothetical protein